MRIVLLHRLQQAQVPLLHQIQQVFVGAAVLVGNLDHQAQVRGDKPPGQHRVARLLKLHRQLVLLLTRHQRIAADLVHVLRQRVGLGQRGTTSPRLWLSAGFLLTVVGRGQCCFQCRIGQDINRFVRQPLYCLHTLGQLGQVQVILCQQARRGLPRLRLVI